MTKRSNKKRRRRGKGSGRGYRRLSDDAILLPEGYSPDELAEQMSDPHSKLRRAIDDETICSMMDVDDPALALWVYAMAALRMHLLKPHAMVDPHRNRPRIEALLRRLGAARVIDIPGSVYGEIYHSVDVYTTEEIVGEKWSAPVTSDRFTDKTPQEKIGEYFDPILEAHRTLAYPERVPFPVTFFAFTSPAPILPANGAGALYRGMKLEQADRELGIADDENIAAMRVIGILVCADGSACEFIETKLTDGMASIAPFEIHTAAHGWANEFLLNGWIVRALVDLVNSYRAISVTEHNPGFVTRRQMRKRSKQAGLGIVPKPFYRVRLHTSITRRSWEETKAKLEDEREPQSGRKRTYRSDVRGHERLYVHRGPKPIADELRDKLEGRGFRVYVDAVEPADLVRMGARGLRPKAADEWIALRHTWVETHVSPRDESLPYVPSIHEVPT